MDDGGSSEANGARQLPRYNALLSFILERELAEVYLLLDNLSTNANKDLPDPATLPLSKVASPPPTPTPADVAQGGVSPVVAAPLTATLLAAPPKDDAVHAFVARICQIVWPSDKDLVTQADQAATLIWAKNLLNEKAAPATGETIAFTVLVAGDANSDKPSWMDNLLRRPPERPDVGLGNAASESLDDGGSGAGSSLPVSRRRLATIAYPGLVKPARLLRGWITGILLGLAGLFMLTCVLSWDVAVGNAFLVQLDKIHAKEADGDKGLGETKGNGATPSAQAISPSSCISYLTGSPFSSAAPNNVTATSAPTTPSPNVVAFCESWIRNRNEYAAVSIEIRNWLAGWLWLDNLRDAWAENLGDRSTSDRSFDRRGDLDNRSRNEQWATVLIGVLSGNVLPILYGLLGAGAAVLRGISQKMRDSMLAPRDLQMSLAQMVLGAVIGGCIGLFVSPAGATTGSSLFGSVPLSASALCFIAGFGVEGVFLALETLVRRVFNIPDPGKRAGT